MCLVSIIIPAYNVASLLPACLDSCLAQTFHDFEIIVVDDGSSDNTAEVVKHYQELTDCIHLIRKRNGGLVLARRAGLAQASGKFVFFVDADDIIEKRALEILYKKSSQYDIVIGNIAIENEAGNQLYVQSRNIMKYGNDNKGMLCNYLEKTVAPSLCGRLIRRSLLEDIKTPEEMTIGEDVITNLLILEKNSIKTILVEDVLYHYIQHRHSMVNTHNLPNLLKRSNYVKWVYNFAKGRVKEISVLNNFVINEYYAFLRDGGDKAIDKELSHIVYKECWDSCIVRNMPKWKRLMLYMFRDVPRLGKLYRYLFQALRKQINRI